MHKRKAFMVFIDERTTEALRALAVNKGIICKRGPGAVVSRGNVSGLLIQLADEYIAASKNQRQRGNKAGGLDSDSG